MLTINLIYIAAKGAVKDKDFYNCLPTSLFLDAFMILGIWSVIRMI